MAKNRHLQQLAEIGQSVWYDNLSRGVLRSGELKRLIDSGVSGLTSNPTIFKKAIADSTDYDREILAFKAKGLSADEICEELMVGDVKEAADLLQHVYRESKGKDGFASLEVSPLLAHEVEGTIAAARRLWSKLSRPNAMIKVPATAEGIRAVRELLAAGINVNITLIFSVEVYRQVIEAYLSALEQRVAEGQAVSSVSSVASFFVSRVDAICEKNGAVSGDFLGKVGIANSKIAYHTFQEAFAAKRFGALSRSGAMVQRPLWASTGTKNPAFSPTLYVEELAGPDTVNTAPPETLAALMQHAEIESRLGRGIDNARALLQRLNQSGINLERLLSELSEAGVAAFAASYRELVAEIANKMR